MRAWESNGRRQLAFGVSVAAVAVLLRWPFLQVPLISDEGAYAYIARFWSSDYALYRDIPIDRPQGLFLLYRAALTMGNDVVAVRLFAALYNGVTTAALFYFLRLALGFRAAAWGSVLFAVLSVSPSTEGFTANAEIFTLLPLVLSAMFAWRKEWVAAGFAAGLATVIKPNGIAGLILACAWALWQHRSWRPVARVAAGFTPVILASLLHGYVVDWQAYWASFVDRRLLLYSAASSGLRYQVDRLYQGVSSTLPAWLGLALVSTLTVLRRRDAVVQFGLLWTGASVLGMALGGEWHAHYFQQLVPSLVLLAVSVGPVLAHRGLRSAAAVAAMAGLALFLVGDGRMWLLPPERISLECFNRPPYLDAEAAAQLVAKNTSPGDAIYVAFAEPEIYFLAGRRAAVPQFFYREVLYSEQIFRQVVTALEARVPAVVILAQASPRRWMEQEQFMKLLGRHYRPVRKVGSLMIFVRKPAAG